MVKDSWAAEYHLGEGTVEKAIVAFVGHGEIHIFPVQFISQPEAETR
jgi:hypothetical protein